jgi:hypothetical protein
MRRRAGHGHVAANRHPPSARSHPIRSRTSFLCNSTTFTPLTPSSYRLAIATASA